MAKKPDPSLDEVCEYLEGLEVIIISDNFIIAPKEYWKLKGNKGSLKDKLISNMRKDGHLE